MCVSAASRFAESVRSTICCSTLPPYPVSGKHQGETVCVNPPYFSIRTVTSIYLSIYSILLEVTLLFTQGYHLKILHHFPNHLKKKYLIPILQKRWEQKIPYSYFGISMCKHAILMSVFVEILSFSREQSQSVFMWIVRSQILMSVKTLPAVFCGTWHWQTGTLLWWLSLLKLHI